MKLFWSPAVVYWTVWNHVGVLTAQGSVFFKRLLLPEKIWVGQRWERVPPAQPFSQHISIYFSQGGQSTGLILRGKDHIVKCVLSCILWQIQTTKHKHLKNTCVTIIETPEGHHKLILNFVSVSKSENQDIDAPVVLLAEQENQFKNWDVRLVVGSDVWSEA